MFAVPRKSYQVRDALFHEAKKKGFVARSVFKLQEIQKRFQILRRGFRVLDLGAAPGSWSQEALKHVGATGLVVAVDPSPLRVEAERLQYWATGIEELLADPQWFARESNFDVVLSDAMVKTVGIAESDSARSIALVEGVLKISQSSALKAQGHMVAKIFQGSGFHELLRDMKLVFEKVHVVRPESVRETSHESYLVALRKKK